MTGPKPLDTRYKGYRFRSRLEARWAVFFDALNIEYLYEPEGFQLKAGRYLPDFQLVGSFPVAAFENNHWGTVGFRDDFFVEVKPPKKLSKSTLRKLWEFSGFHPLLISHGTPDHVLISYFDGGNYVRGLYFGLFEVPDAKGAIEYSGPGLIISPRQNDFEPVEEAMPGFYAMTSAHPDMQVAYEKARSARFEHGERPSTF
jgi:hypothetical protein